MGCDNCGSRFDTTCNHGSDCWRYEQGNCWFCHCAENDEDEDAFIEVKCWSNPIYPNTARGLVDQGVAGVLCGGEISDKAKEILDEAGIWYFENVEPHELERAVREGEAEWD